MTVSHNVLPGGITMPFLQCMTSSSRSRWNSSDILSDREAARVVRGRRRKRFVAGVGLLGALAFSLPAVAATATATMAISATVDATCQISTTPLAFSTYTGSQTDATATVSVTCTNTTPYNVGFDAGLGAGATVTTRTMSITGASLPYSLFQDAGRTVNWGNTVGTDTVAGTGTGSAQTLTVYGRIGAGQLVTPGAYTDTITATVTY
ncbi:Csu type fimbrial protein [Burkholderia ambifaria]|uniref:Csu type fimbrial protein n=2 Tax=Burkholderia ambifaria TaxID=152480 RepID=UPI001FC80343|nr:spore coat U domain-containing protein [Burkholderia ambifaria]WAS59068.1 spore coat U domain-containing protein [Burkholderia ambifaria]WDR98082.1 spore coat U domain-containing protein [Burkholderia ambifaria]